MSRDETPDTTGLREALSAHFVMWHDLNDLAGPSGEWRCQCGLMFGFSDSAIDHQTTALANHVAAAREADRAEVEAKVEKAVAEHAEHMGTYTLPALAPGFLDGYHHALRLLTRDADAIAHRATRSAS